MIVNLGTFPPIFASSSFAPSKSLGSYAIFEPLSNAVPPALRGASWTFEVELCRDADKLGPGEEGARSSSSGCVLEEGAATRRLERPDAMVMSR